MLALTIMASSHDMLHTYKACGVEAYRPSPRTITLLASGQIEKAGTRTDQGNVGGGWLPWLSKGGYAWAWDCNGTWDGVGPLCAGVLFGNRFMWGCVWGVKGHQRLWKVCWNVMCGKGPIAPVGTGKGPCWLEPYWCISGWGWGAEISGGRCARGNDRGGKEVVNVCLKIVCLKR